MTVDIARLAAAPSPSPLLRHLAGEAAEALACVWPQPHTPYLAASAPRRHLLGVALAFGADLDAGTATAGLEFPVQRAIMLLIPGAPPGLRRALEQMDELGWPLETYRRLVRLLHQPAAATALRHAASLDPVTVDGLAKTPAPLLEAGLARFRLGPEFADTVRDCYDALVERDGAERAAALAFQWGKARTAASLFKRIEEDLLGKLFASPFPPTQRLRWIETKSEMRAAARRYRNCLANYLEEAAKGEAVFGEWLESPGAILQVSRDPVFGWRLEQARGPGNEMMAEPAREALTGELSQLGIRVGRSGRDLRIAARRAAGGETLPEHWLEDYVDVFGAAA